MSGEEFFSNSHLQGHVCYGLRKESSTFNLAFFVGPSIYQGVAGRPPAPPEVYEGLGLYADLQLIKKLTYDIGAGLELFCDLGFAATGREQVMYGAKFILFFSGSYRGVKRNYNPNVRSENPNG
jgi:hypothetical protein